MVRFEETLLCPLCNNGWAQMFQQDPAAGWQPASSPDNLLRHLQAVEPPPPLRHGGGTEPAALTCGAAAIVAATRHHQPLRHLHHEHIIRDIAENAQRPADVDIVQCCAWGNRCARCCPPPSAAALLWEELSHVAMHIATEPVQRLRHGLRFVIGCADFPRPTLRPELLLATIRRCLTS